MSIILIIILVPLWLLITLLIKVSSNGPVLFKQSRIGLNKARFHILKFRTMKIDTPKDCPTHLLEEPDKYITPIGKLLRKSSLDELPQLINILKGDMSFIGPRPALWNQYDLIEEREVFGVNNVLPGLTGWAQVNGRDELQISEKVYFDCEYIKRFGIKMDLNCLKKTIISILSGKGVKEGNTQISN
jgi:O-antigen biosynthesis protein WbqP